MDRKLKIEITVDDDIWADFCLLLEDESFMGPYAHRPPSEMLSRYMISLIRNHRIAQAQEMYEDRVPGSRKESL